MGFTWERQPFPADIPAAVDSLRKCGAYRIMANSVGGEVARTIGEMMAGNDEVAQAGRDYPDFVIPACLINTKKVFLCTVSFGKIRNHPGKAPRLAGRRAITGYSVDFFPR
jgi:hypothetical protein